MTRRIIPQLLNVKYPDISDWGLQDGGKAMITLYEGGRPTTDIFPTYQPGEVVAIAQSYLSLADELQADEQWESRYEIWKPFRRFLFNGDDHTLDAGWKNKMFVRAELMRHFIQITNIKVERLQDISYEDCFKEGVFKDVTAPECYQPFYTFVNARTKDNTPIGFDAPQYAFQVLIDKISGLGTWDRNPYVFAYTFKLIK